jgi:hypothetical protein
MVQKTRKVKALSIPQLRKSFDHIDFWVESHVKKVRSKIDPGLSKRTEKDVSQACRCEGGRSALPIKAHAAPRMSRKHKQAGGTQELQGGTS